MPGYFSSRKLGDVTPLLYALGYHQQQTEAFRIALHFLRGLRHAAFFLSYIYAPPIIMSQYFLNISGLSAPNLTEVLSL